MAFQIIVEKEVWKAKPGQQSSFNQGQLLLQTKKGRGKGMIERLLRLLLLQRYFRLMAN